MEPSNFKKSGQEGSPQKPYMHRIEVKAVGIINSCCWRARNWQRRRSELQNFGPFLDVELRQRKLNKQKKKSTTLINFFSGKKNRREKSQQ